MWFFTNQDGYIMKKKQSSLTSEVIIECLNKFKEPDTPIAIGYRYFDENDVRLISTGSST